MLIGKIIKSNTHTDYICQVYGPGEKESPPAREDYAFGTFVGVDLGEGRCLVGIIYDTMLFNPDFGRMGPRLSPEAELAVFSPDYLEEKAVLIGILAVGMVATSGAVLQGVPPLAATSDALVEKLTDDEIRVFHRGKPALQLAYAPLVLAQKSPLALHLLQTVIDRLVSLFPEQVGLLSVVKSDLAWKAQIGPMGGVR